ncbi:hypothetical protein [Methanospirillum sp.]
MVTKTTLNQRIKMLEKSSIPSSNYAVIIYRDEQDLELQKANVGNKKFCICLPDNGRDT